MGAQAATLFEASLTPEQKAVFEVLRADQALFVDDIAERRASSLIREFWGRFWNWR